VSNGSTPFSIGWILSDTTYSIRHLQSGDADVAITYSPAAEKIAGDQGIIDPETYYLFRDHFLIVGPLENPAKIAESSDVPSIMASIFQSAEKNNASTAIPTRWLTRYDKSATNIKESQLWLGIGQARNNRATTCVPKLSISGSLGHSLLHLVPPVHCLPHPSAHNGHCNQGVHANRSRDIPFPAKLPS
jgi:ABC-type tungstate transport system permease subunit